MNIALLNPPSEKGQYEHEHLSIPKIGLCYIASFLEREGIPCFLIDAKFEGLSFEETIGRLEKLNPDILGISAMTPEINSAARVAAELKSRIPGVTTVIGGAHAISIPEGTLEEFPQFDILVNGEGELTLLELSRTLENGGSLEGVKGILYRENGTIRTTPPREYIEDLDSLPMPAWDRFEKRPPFYYILSCRGCPFNCAFCMTILGKKQRQRSPENVVDEIQWLADNRGMTDMTFLDGTFTLHRERTNRLLDLLIERGLHRRVRWIAQTRVDRVDEDLFVKMKEAGCYKIEFGVESGNEKILKIIKKRISLEQVEEAVRLAKKASLQTACSFILGHPYETRETLKDTIDFITKLNPHSVSVGIMVPHPGTVVYEMAKAGEGGYRLTSTDWNDYVKFGGGGLEFENLSRKELEKYQAKAYLSLYLKNYRFFDFMAYALEHRTQAKVAAKKLIRDIIGPRYIRRRKPRPAPQPNA